MAIKTVLEAVRDAMYEEMSRDQEVLIMGEDIAERGGVFLATDGFIQDFGPERVIDTPLAESAIAGVALGAAVNGLRPIAEIEFADFVWPAVNQIVGEASRVRYGTDGTRCAPMVVRMPYGGGVRGGLYHSQSVEVMFAHQPGLLVVAPATPYDAKGLLKSAIRNNNPVLYFEHKRAYNLIRGDVPDGDFTVPIGEAVVRRPGSDISLISYGLSVHDCLEAAETMGEEGTSCEVVDLRTIKPMDTETVLSSVKKTGKVCIVHEDNLTGGVGAEVAAIIAREAFEYLDGPIYRVAAPDVPSFPYSPGLEELCLPTPQKIVEAVRELSAY